MTLRRSETTYHVEIETKIPTARFIVRPNLTLPQLQERILSNYEGGNPITLRGVTVWPEDIVRITVAATYSEVHNSNSRRRLVDFLRDVNAKDATDLLITGPPGWKAEEKTDNKPEQLALSQVYDCMITNEQLREVSRQRFFDGYYSDAVVEAFKCLNNAVKDKSGRTGADGADLMHTVFSPNNPVLFLNEFSSKSDRIEQQGYMDIFAGSMMGIRNPRAHEHGLVDGPEVALEMLVFANHLMRKLDSATKKEPEATEE